MPSAPHSRAAVRVRARISSFEELYAPYPAAPRIPLAEAKFTTSPSTPCSVMPASSATGDRDEGVEQRLLDGVGRGRVLGVPLHAGDPAGTGKLDGLDGAVGIARRHGEAGAEPVDGLVVV